MSVDMREPFATGWMAWPQVLGIPCFILYGAAALWLLLQRGKRGLLGFAMLFPWLMFATELSTVRIQEPFVLYRSYLWAPGIFSALPLLFGHLPARRIVIYALSVAVLLAPLAWNRLTSLSHPLLLWDDAASLLQGRPYLPGFERIYFNRGHAFYQAGMQQRAIEDYNRVIAQQPDFSYAYNDRGVIYYERKQLQDALNDFNKSIQLKPDFANPYHGRALILEALHSETAAQQDFVRSCQLGRQAACDKLSTNTISASSEPPQSP
jgi:tetratricopeptide (TPR) repeat protein